MSNHPEHERDLGRAVGDFTLGALMGLGAVATGALTESYAFENVPGTEGQILFGAIATIALVLIARKGFQSFWEEIHKPKPIKSQTDIEPPGGG